MKKASLFEIVMARCWNVLNEGKTFTPVFVVTMFVLYEGWQGTLNGWQFWSALSMALPAFVVFYLYDFPLHLRHFLWVPLLVSVQMFGAQPGLLMLAFGMYVFFTVFFWGTLYYHLRIGTTWWNWTRIWKLFLKNTDSTSGNVLEQLPKVFTLLGLMAFAGRVGPSEGSLLYVGLFELGLVVYAIAVHRWLFNWKPEEYERYAAAGTVYGKPLAKKVIVVVIDGCRKERLYEADTPFLDRLMEQGVLYEQMETTYPARTVSCFSSMFTGTYPREHGMKSNMVWKLGVRVESIFDVLKKQGKKGVLFGCAHLIDAFCDHVESFTAVAHNDVVDHLIMKQAKAIYERENPDLFVVQMIAVDQTGHSRGVLYPEYLEKIAEADALIADFYGWLQARGDLEDALFVVMADHGQGNGIGGHGHLDEGERYVPFFLHGPCVKQGLVVEEHRSIVSLAATIAAVLGVPIPAAARGPVLTEALREKSEEK
jgi:hypothetical protein